MKTPFRDLEPIGLLPGRTESFSAVTTFSIISLFKNIFIEDTAFFCAALLSTVAFLARRNRLVQERSPLVCCSETSGTRPSAATLLRNQPPTLTFSLSNTGRNSQPTRDHQTKQGLFSVKRFWFALQGVLSRKTHVPKQVTPARARVAFRKRERMIACANVPEPQARIWPLRNRGPAFRFFPPPPTYGYP